MPSLRSPTDDLPLSLGLSTVGIAALTAAAAQGPAAFHFLPALDGCLTVGVVGLVLALTARIPYRQGLVLMLPVFVIQVIGARLQGSSPFAVLGIEAVVLGLIGTALSLRARAGTPAPEPTRARPRITRLARPTTAHVG